MAGAGRFSRLAPQVQDKIFALQHCSPDELDDRVLNLLSSIPAAEQVDALAKLDSALRTQRADVRNVSAFLAGVIKRMSGSHGGGMGPHGGGGMGPPGRGPPGGGGGGGGGPYGHHSGPPPAAPQGATEAQLAPAAAQVLDRLYAEGRLRRGDLDSRSLGSLAALQPEAQAFVMHTFADRNLSTVRNMSGFFASHLANAERDIREGRVRLPPPQQQPAGTRQPLGSGPAPPRGQLPPGAAAPQGGMQWGGPQQGPPGMQQPYDTISGAYDPSEVAPPHLQQQQPFAQQQQAFAGQPPPQQPQMQPQVQQAQQQGLAGLPVDLQQLDGLLQSLAAQQPLQAAKPQAPAPQQAQQLGLTLPSAPAAGAAAAPAAGTAGTPTGAAAAAKHFGLEQLEWGVRVDEFHSLSPFAKYVHPAAALKLQQLWDAGNKLVSLMDDVSWEALAGLDAQHAVAVVGEVAEGVRTAPDDMAAANRAMVAAAARHPKRANAPTAASVGAVPAAQAAGPPAPMVHVQPAPQQAAYGGMPLQQAAPALPGMGGLQQPLAGQAPLGQVPLGMAPQQQLSPPLQPAVLQPQQPGYGMPPPSLPPSLPGQSQLPPHLQQAPLQHPGMPGMAGGQLGGMPPPPGGRGPLPLAPGGMPPPAGGLPPVPQLPGPCGELPAVVQARIARLMEGSAGMVRLEHFESRVLEMLMKMGPEAALRGLEDFARNDPRSMRSVTAYLIGCLKQYGEEGRPGPGGPPMDPYGPPPSHGPGPGPDRPRDQHRYRAGGSRWEDRGPSGPPGGRGGGGRGPYDDSRGGRGGGRGPYYGRGGGGMGRGRERERVPGPRASPTYDTY